MNKKLSIGTEIFYTGDAVNRESKGVITERSGSSLTVRLDDGGHFVIGVRAFVPGPRCRFMVRQAV